MRIAHITHSFPPYEAGTGRVCYFNAIELGRLGHDVTVFTPEYPPGKFEYPPEITVKRLPAPLRLGNAPLMPGLLTQVRQFDIIHLHFPFIFGAELTWLISTLRNIPYVLTHHNDLITVGNRQLLFDAYFPITKFLAVRNASKYAVVSLNHAEHCALTPIYKRRWDDVVEIPNGVDTSIFYPSEKGALVPEQLGIPPAAPVIAFVGALDKAHLFKGVGRLIEAFAKLKSQQTYLMIVGGGELLEHYQQIAVQTGVSDRIVFTGNIHHDQLGAYYNAADVVVLPSDPPESFGMVLIEANACGRPVVASDIPGIRSVVDNNSTGLLFQQGSVDDLAAKLDTLIENPDLRKQFGQAGEQKVHQRYQWSAVAKKLERLYEDVLVQKQSVLAVSK